jgi:hypothetical protein
VRSFVQDFNAMAAVQRELDWAQAVDDLNAERSGLPTGRQIRFLHDTAHDGIAGNRRSKNRGDDALEFAFMAQQSYEALLNDTWDRLRDAETAAERALQRAQDKLTASAAALQTTLDRAATLPDGTRVFRDADDRVWDEHRETVDPTDAATVEWQGFEPSFETLVIRQDAVSHDQQRIDTIRGHQVTLGEHRERMDEGGLSRDALEDIGESIDEMTAEFEAFAPDDSIAPERAVTSGIVLPTLGGS